MLDWIASRSRTKRPCAGRDLLTWFDRLVWQNGVRTIDGAPQTRNVAAGQAVWSVAEFARTAYVARPLVCDVPFPFFLDFEMSDEDGLVVDHSAATTGRTTFCTNDIHSFTLQTARPPCSSPGTRQVRLTPRFRTASSDFAEVLQNSMFSESGNGTGPTTWLNEQDIPCRPPPEQCEASTVGSATTLTDRLRCADKLIPDY
ncbi:hypothetical protein [Candidatus Poriferisodalis sp.]|uniref:hypothetical protein n=1 Tax=Candidatus Poriferisodalis sp. TaxID=3101277 RepID=UPI003B01690A